jgi:hypothetical protein
MATIQGSIILAKAAENDDLIRRSLAHVRDYIVTQLPAPLKKGRKRS